MIFNCNNAASVALHLDRQVSSCLSGIYFFCENKMHYRGLQTSYERTETDLWPFNLKPAPCSIFMSILTASIGIKMVSNRQLLLIKCTLLSDHQKVRAPPIKAEALVVCWSGALRCTIEQSSLWKWSGRPCKFTSKSDDGHKNQKQKCLCLFAQQNELMMV